MMDQAGKKHSHNKHIAITAGKNHSHLAKTVHQHV
jgi:hypothetical protein